VSILDTQSLRRTALIASFCHNNVPLRAIHGLSASRSQTQMTSCDLLADLFFVIVADTGRLALSVLSGSSYSPFALLTLWCGMSPSSVKCHLLFL
jgi:hypothetical protein